MMSSAEYRCNNCLGRVALIQRGHEGGWVCSTCHTCYGTPILKGDLEYIVSTDLGLRPYSEVVSPQPSFAMDSERMDRRRLGRALVVYGTAGLAAAVSIAVTIQLILSEEVKAVALCLRNTFV